jgi:DNA-binding MarR family transcriptional regulator
VNSGLQIEKAGGFGYFRQVAPDRKEEISSFRALFLLSRWNGVSPGVLRQQLGLSDDDFDALLDRLQRMYLVDSVSELRGESIMEYYTLTDEGKTALQQMLERMCELPEVE